MKEELFTIGHSNHPLHRFTELLRTHGITAVADVRSRPYSKFAPWYNGNTLSESLKKAGIDYVFLGKELGARRDEKECYVDGKADYHRIAKHFRFQEGLTRIRNGLRKHRIALMCAEKDPIACHRTILICRNLRSDDIQIRHILSDGSLENNEESEKRIVKLFKLHEADLFKSESARIEEAYERQANNIAYTEDKNANDEKVEGGKKVSIATLYTIGFTKKKAETFFGALKQAGIKRIIDVRLNNVSQLAGFAKRNDLIFFLKGLCGCG